MSPDLHFTVLCPFGGSGGGALGFLGAEVRLLGAVGCFRCLGSIEPVKRAKSSQATASKSAAWCVDVEAITPEEIRVRCGGGDRWAMKRD